MLTPAERRLRSRAAAYALHAQGGTATHAGTAAFLNRFEREVDPTGTLAPEERARRAMFARKSYMANLSLRAMKARRLAGPSEQAMARIAEIERLLTAVEGGDVADDSKERSDDR
jgi:murein L,D-transpeptidase YcbB/YkuD